MKKNLLLITCLVWINFAWAQEWITSLDAAKRLSIVQNKPLFVMWEESTLYDFPVVVRSVQGNLVLTDLFKDEQIAKIIWDKFIPVKLTEDQHAQLVKQIEDRSTSYINKFNDDSIKIMDANGNIINTKEPYYEIFDINDFIGRYGLNMVYLQSNLRSYRENNGFTSALRLALKLYDFAVINKKVVKIELVELGNIYLNEAKAFLAKSNPNDQEMLLKLQLSELRPYLVLNKPKKVLRTLKKIERNTLNETNMATYNFLNYVALRLSNNSVEAMQFQTSLSLIDLKKAQLIINSNK